jgi:hypothetical protein
MYEWKYSRRENCIVQLLLGHSVEQTSDSLLTDQYETEMKLDEKE